MDQSHPSFQKPPPERWEPQVGDQVLLAYRGKIFVVTVTQILEDPRAYVVSGDELLIPVCCGRDSLRPFN